MHCGERIFELNIALRQRYKLTLRQRRRRTDPSDVRQGQGLPAADAPSAQRNREGSDLHAATIDLQPVQIVAQNGGDRLGRGPPLLTRPTPASTAHPPDHKST